MVGVHEIVQHMSNGQISKFWLRFWFKMAEKKDMHLLLTKEKQNCN